MKKAPVVITKNLDDSFKRNPIIHLESIKEDGQDDDYYKYNDDFEPANYAADDEIISPVKKSSKGYRVIKENVIGSNMLLDMHLNPKSAEPHLHKSKIKNLQPLQELCNQLPVYINEIRTP